MGFSDRKVHAPVHLWKTGLFIVVNRYKNLAGLRISS